jgi:hypothetical protein
VRLSENTNENGYVTLTLTGHPGVAAPTHPVTTGQVVETVRLLASNPPTAERTYV